LDREIYLRRKDFGRSIVPIKSSVSLNFTREWYLIYIGKALLKINITTRNKKKLIKKVMKFNPNYMTNFNYKIFT
jgi:hypothetical protein